MYPIDNNDYYYYIDVTNKRTLLQNHRQHTYINWLKHIMYTKQRLLAYRFNRFQHCKALERKKKGPYLSLHLYTAIRTLLGAKCNAYVHTYV